MSIRLLFITTTMLFVTDLASQNPLRRRLSLWADSLGPVVDIAHGGDDRLFVVGQNGVVRIVADSQVVLARPFLDISTQVLYSGEQGLLGLAFDPDFASNGAFYVNYISTSGGLHSRISRFTVSSDPDSADTASEQIILTVDQPFSNHNGGDLDFGLDGMLYVPFGDGGSGGDPDNHAQDLSDMLGDLIRIDVSDPDTTYTVPPDNPFVGAGPDTLPEIWASGLRNPFRFGFDRLTGDMWLGDVGQNAWEEIDHWPGGDNSGPNFGWRCYEGLAPYDIGGCQPQSFYVDPVSVHLNDALGGTWCASVGGRVYRGVQWPNMFGRYIYTDFCAQEIWNLRPDGMGGWIDELSFEPGQSGYSCIAERTDGELFAGNVGNGKIYRILDKCPMDPPVIAQNGSDLESSTANGWQWFFNGDTIPGAVAQVLSPTMTGDYHVVADFGNGCLLNSDTIPYIYTGQPRVSSTFVQVLPNPVDRELVIRWTGEPPTQLRLVDATGRVALMVATSGRSAVVPIDQLPAAVYLLQFTSANGALVATQRVVVAR